MKATEKIRKQSELRKKLFNLFNIESANELRGLSDKEFNSFFRIYDKARKKINLN